MNLFKHVWREADMSTLSPMPPENANEDAQLLFYVSLFSDYRYLDGPLLLQIIFVCIRTDSSHPNTRNHRRGISFDPGLSSCASGNKPELLQYSLEFCFAIAGMYTNVFTPRNQVAAIG